MDNEKVKKPFNLIKFLTWVVIILMIVSITMTVVNTVYYLHFVNQLESIVNQLESTNMLPSLP